MGLLVACVGGRVFIVKRFGRVGQYATAWGCGIPQRGFVESLAGARLRESLLLAIVVATLAMQVSSRPVHAVWMDVVPVGSPGNAGELSGKGAGGFGQDAIVGGVAYSFYMASYEVTNGQYAEFLNAQASSSDPWSLYSTKMTTDARGGIERTGVEGSYRYAAKPLMSDKPVNFVGFRDAVRFTNWLHHGQKIGSDGSDTETGAYIITASGVQPRSPEARWFLPSEDEWYKAAYYDPTRNSGTGGFHEYATRSDSIPQPAIADAAGVISNSGPGVANYARAANWGGLHGNVTTVGSAGPGATSYFGTSDQAGNLWEWNESSFGLTGRGVRGGSWDDVAASMAARMRLSYDANDGEGTRFLGFRVATLAPPTPAMPGDLNNSGQLDAADIDQLAEQIRKGFQLARYDLNGDRRVDIGDHRFWIDAVAHTYAGDTNLDGQFSSTDITLAFQLGGYEDGQPLNSLWSGGDWNGDGDFSSADFVLAFQSGGYEKGVRPPAVAVPEATLPAFCLLGILLAVARRRP